MEENCFVMKWLTTGMIKHQWNMIKSNFLDSNFWHVYLYYSLLLCLLNLIWISELCQNYGWKQQLVVFMASIWDI